MIGGLDILYLVPDGSSMEHFSEDFGVLINSMIWGIWKGIKEDRYWALDNSCFTKEFDIDRYKNKISKLSPYMNKCLFVVMPDVVGDAKKTMDLYLEWHDVFSELDVPLAFVCQDGQLPNEIPDCDAIFIGGSNEFKLSPRAVKCMDWGRSHGKWVHVGRVNTWKRIQWAYENGADSVDGTCIAFCRDEKIPYLKQSMRMLGRQKCMF